MNRVLATLGILFGVVVFPGIASASVVFSEVMYDLAEGADSGREWVEVFNSGSEGVSLSGWRFSENGTNHTLNSISGSETLAPGAYAIITDNADAFSADWPGFSGTLFDSSFSLKNTGEKLILRDTDLNDIDTVSYTSDWGAAGDGNSLYLSAAGSWAAGAPTPGTGSLQVQEAPQPPETGSEGSSGGSSASAPVFSIEPQIHASAGRDRVVTVGADTEFKGRAIGLKGEPIEGARYLWNFGDGSIKEGESVLYRYRYPGEYVAVLDVASGKYAASDRVIVTALPARIRVSDANGTFIALTNEGDREIDLSWWILASPQTSFTLPEHTIILPGNTLKFPADVTGISVESPAMVAFKYPNGTLVESPDDSKQKETPQSVERSTVQPKTTNRAGTPIVGMTFPAPPPEEAREDAPETPRQAVSQVQSESPLASASASGVPLSSVLALIGVIMFGVISVLFLRRASRDEITIIE